MSESQGISGVFWAGVPAIRWGTLCRTPSRSRPSLQQRCLLVWFLVPVPGPASLVAWLLVRIAASLRRHESSTKRHVQRVVRSKLGLPGLSIRCHWPGVWSLSHRAARQARWPRSSNFPSFPNHSPGFEPARPSLTLHSPTSSASSPRVCGAVRVSLESPAPTHVPPGPEQSLNLTGTASPNNLLGSVTTLWSDPFTDARQNPPSHSRLMATRLGGHGPGQNICPGWCQQFKRTRFRSPGKMHVEIKYFLKLPAARGLT